MKKLYILLLGSMLFTAACDNDLDQVPPNIASSDSLDDFSGVVNAAYFYQLGAVTPMAVMGDFRADNALMDEEPFPEFDRYGPDLTVMEDQFFGPFYTALYKSILSANNVIENSTDATDIGEARFLRALSYFKLVLVFGDVPVNLVANPSTTDLSIFERQPIAEVYNNVIIPDFQDAIAALDNSDVASGRASQIAAQALLGKVYMHRGDFGSAEPLLATVINGAASAGISLQANFADIFLNDLNSEVIFATQVSSSIVDEYGFSEFFSWFGGLDTKSLMPLDPDLIAAFDASEVGGGTDLRRVVTIDETLMASPKYPQTGGEDLDWIEMRLADAILLYAETLNENGNTPGALVELNKIRTRAGLANSTAVTQVEVRQAIQDERRLELAFEGHRWFDLVRTGTAEAEIGQTIDSNYFLFPVPISEILATNGVITQNPGY
ncbi:RagB/SusD family nutrient uptake outer membrane protein [Flagellimonas allohymeniacidonis]|uniref:RagB/SusD family nutrient uptake outer membrane protein n=1 Tax=Flagellimonas allohymeniacidonis TaxID=2517819 RepID=A0A4Q8QI85_9FLAO|nr:RagB/SusD family nutrient uptake outer membrane protein [Allomuricauda hymeniacidonis]TAI48403.1 RagB/SusD family nutrient uptake outer membrane protein [Allomuricauda hymeniacidonis]